MRSSHVLPGMVVGLLLTSSGLAYAQDKRPEPAPKETAEQLAEQGYTAYEGGKFTDAVGLYMRAFQLSGDARLLYNVASIYDKKLHDRGLAEDFYRRYLRSTTTEPSLVKKANERLLEMKNETDTLAENGKSAKPSPAPPVATVASPAPAPAPSSTLRAAGYVTAAAGLVLVGVGTGFGFSAKSKADDVRDDCPNDLCRSATSVDQREDAATAATLSTIFFGAGLAAIAGGVVMVLVSPKSSPKTAVVTPRLRITGASLAGTF